MNSKDFYKALLEESGVSDHTYKTISQSILTSESLSSYEKMQELKTMNEVYEQMSSDNNMTGLLN